ncbi:MAG: ABC transporter permease [Sulfobacillus sp.]
MSSLRVESRAALSLVQRNLHLVKRYFGWEAVFLFYNVINTLTIGLIASLTPPAQRAGIVLYLVIGALLWNFLSILFQEVSNSIQWERWEGTIEYSMMAPIHRLTYLGGVCLWGSLYGLIRTAVVLIAVIFFFHLSLAGADLPGALLIVLASILPFIGLGLMGAVLPLMSAERGAQATQVIQGVILLVSGVYYPVSALPQPLRAMGILSPATYTLQATRDAMLHGASVASLLPTAGGLVAAGLVTIPIGLLIFSWGERYAMRAGKLKRNG